MALVAAGGFVWLGAAASRGLGMAGAAAALALGVAAALRMRSAWMLVLVLVGMASGWASLQREAGLATTQLPQGRVELAGRAATDPRRWGDEIRFTFTPSHLRQGGDWHVWQGPSLSASLDDGVEVVAGDRVLVQGRMVADLHRVRSFAQAGVVLGADVIKLSSASDPAFVVGNLLRSRVQSQLGRLGARPEGALLGGFLIGDTDAVPQQDMEALRRSGLAHFVAVSGSNVALFLGAWWIALGPLAWGPRRRAVVGLAGLAIFVVATRWEPSVVRAATMAGLMLSGRLIGLPFDAWAALGGAVAVLVAFSGHLVSQLGFQLSVAATAGVLAGAGLFGDRNPRWAWSALGATVSAQVAVAPLLLWQFGSIPLFAPLANLIAAPLVATATAAGGVGTLVGWQPLTAFGVGMARIVLWVARIASDWPQLGLGWMALVAAGGLAWSRASLRPAVSVAAAVVLAVTVVPPRSLPASPTAVFLDVGQGDSTLLLGSNGEVILVDGGPDPQRLTALLRGRGIRRIDLLAISHRHADHIGGLEAVVGTIPIANLWYPGRQPFDDRLSELLARAEATGTTVVAPAVGSVIDVGAFRLEVVGPLRRYVSPNDGSLVLMATTGDTTVALVGDIEAIAQADLGPLQADIMKVPHQGAATSDFEWLVDSRPSLAVVSVGPNSFGHPSTEVIDALRGAGAVVVRTDEEGDVEVPLTGADLGRVGRSLGVIP